MLHRSFRSTISICAATYPFFASGAAPPAQFFVVCASQPNEPTIYFSAVLQGPATAVAGFQRGFTEFLAQRYAYKGVVACLPTNNAANAQNLINTRSSALHNAKKNVVDTGWTQVASAATPAATVAVPQATSPATAAKVAPATAAKVAPGTAAKVAPGTSAGSAGGGSQSQLTSILGSVFGTGSSTSGGGCSATGASGAKSAGSGSGGTGCQNPYGQVSSALAGVFGKKSTDGDKSPQSSASDGGLGSAQAQNTKLVVYGCGRQDSQIACVTDLANQNQKETLVQAADVWKDAFIVDDRGDRHPRSTGFFLNIDGDQRPQLDISYGKTARFILMFDGVQTKVQKVALRSATGGLDVEEINLIVAQGGQH
jgi:hypothetical protein